MKYYIDAEFLQGPQKKKMFGVNYGQTKPLIDLISIGIVGEDNREYYAISKEFNLEEAWNRYDVHTMTNLRGDSDTNKKKVYWIRENVLKPIYNELSSFHISDIPHTHFGGRAIDTRYLTFSYKSLKWLLDKYGKTNKQIAKEIKEFIGTKETIGNWEQVKDKINPQFYAYYGAFDYVAFSQIFGGFENYPESFPQYFIDLKQELDIKASAITNDQMKEWHHYPKTLNIKEPTFDEKLTFIRRMPKYPQEPTTHHTLSDAHWNKQLHEYLNTL
jgi:hypothetical protein